MVTISDIAAALGVTPSTVSRALSGSPRVKEETRLAVERMAAEMGYERNIVASNLRKGRSDIVGIIVPRIHRNFFSNVIGGAESILEAAGYCVLICQTHERFEAEVKALRTLRNNQVAGVLMSHAIGSDNGNHILDVLGDRIPLVQFDRVFSELPGAKVVSNNFEGAYAATKHLVEQGYRRIGTLAGYMNSEAYVARLEGYRQALRDSGLPVDESLVHYDTIVRETGYEAGLKAIDAGCDALYPGGLRHRRHGQRGFHLPDDSVHELSRPEPLRNGPPGRPGLPGRGGGDRRRAHGTESAGILLPQQATKPIDIICLK